MAGEELFAVLLRIKGNGPDEFEPLKWLTVITKPMTKTRTKG